MPLLQLIIALMVIGVLLWAVNTYVPMDEKIKQIMNWVVVIVVIFWLLRLFGILSYVDGIKVGYDQIFLPGITAHV